MMKRSRICCLAVVGGLEVLAPVVVTSGAFAERGNQGLVLLPENPRYFQYRGKPFVSVGYRGARGEETRILTPIAGALVPEASYRHRVLHAGSEKPRDR